MEMEKKENAPKKQKKALSAKASSSLKQNHFFFFFVEPKCLTMVFWVAIVRGILHGTGCFNRNSCFERGKTH
ncbi:hypothetical protein KKE06_01830 [Candidatus Micrarchaeota archaeon]|nr:hypothetical protein [Candidatus Micrarchaeota archaeon]